jgi:hypothetical protein
MSANRSNDRSSLCSFSFADGRRCRTPRCSTHPHLCYFHARKEAQALAAQQMGRDIGRPAAYSPAVVGAAWRLLLFSREEGRLQLF